MKKSAKISNLNFCKKSIDLSKNVPKDKFFFLIAASLEDLMSLAEEIRPYTQDAMKIEMAPWIRDYNVNMEDLYTELALEKLENKPTGPSKQRIENYTDIF